MSLNVVLFVSIMQWAWVPESYMQIITVVYFVSSNLGSSACVQFAWAAVSHLLDTRSINFNEWFCCAASLLRHKNFIIKTLL